MGTGRRGRRWRGRRRNKGGRGGGVNRGPGSGRQGAWHGDYQSGPWYENQQQDEHEVDGDGFLIPMVPSQWNNNRRGGRRGGFRAGRRFNLNFLRSELFEQVAEPQSLPYKIVVECRDCTECGVHEAPYRCPTCRKKYCSVLCYQSHKAGENCKSNREEVAPENGMELDGGGADRLPKPLPYKRVVECRDCTECGVHEAPYRCPTCRKKYCSVLCYQSHKSGENYKSNGDESVPENGMELDGGGAGRVPKPVHRRKPAITKKYLHPTRDTVSLEGLEKLAQEPLRSTMVEMFQSDGLREKIRTLDSLKSSEDPNPLFDEYMKDKEFSEFSSVVVDALSDDIMVKLKVVKRK